MQIVADSEGIFGLVEEVKADEGVYLIYLYIFHEIPSFQTLKCIALHYCYCKQSIVGMEMEYTSCSLWKAW